MRGELASIAIATDQIAIVVATADDDAVVVVVVDVVDAAARTEAAVAIVSQRFRADRVRLDLEVAHGRFHRLGRLEIKAMVFL